MVILSHKWLLQYNASTIAAAALRLAQIVSHSGKWTTSLIKHTGYTSAKLSECMQHLHATTKVSLLQLFLIRRFVDIVLQDSLAGRVPDVRQTSNPNGLVELKTKYGAPKYGRIKSNDIGTSRQLFSNF